MTRMRIMESTWCVCDMTTTNTRTASRTGARARLDAATMADAQSSLRSDLKKQIRALLQSVKRGCTFKQLSMDFRQVMGYDIPFDELGYSTFSQLIHDLPDVVEIRKNRDGSTTLHAVADQRTEHISRLVSKQKSTRALYTQPPPARKPPPRRAPREFSAQLRQLFCCYPQGIPLANFNEAYARRFGRFLQFQPWGYSSLEQLLQDMDGVELVCNPLKGSTMVKSRRKNMSLQLAKKGCSLNFTFPHTAARSTYCT